MVVAAAALAGAVLAAPTLSHLWQWWQLLRYRTYGAIALRQASGAAVALVEAEPQRVICIRVRLRIRISIRLCSIGAAHQRIRIQICSFSPSVLAAARNIKARQEYQSRSRGPFSNSTRSYPGSEF